MSSAPRPSVDFPVDLAADLSRAMKNSGTTLTALFSSWLISAGRLAAAGEGDLLPRTARAARGSVGPVTKLRWKQNSGEIQRCRVLIEGAGSSVPTVLRTAARAYVASGGDPLGMAWPPKSVLVAAA